MLNRASLTISALLAALAAAPVHAQSARSNPAGERSEWTIDNGHSHVGFSVPHMVVSEVEGKFERFQGKVWLDEQDLAKSQVDFSIDAESIDTDNQERDKHLRSADFFDTQKFPKLTFKATKISKAGKGFKLKGELTLRGVTKEITLDATVSEPIQNPWGGQVRAVRVQGKLKREDYGLSWNKTLDKGGVILGSEVTIDIKLELNK